METVWTKFFAVSQIEQLVLTISEILRRGGPNKKGGVRQIIQKLISRGGRLLFGTGELLGAKNVEYCLLPRTFPEE